MISQIRIAIKKRLISVYYRFLLLTYYYAEKGFVFSRIIKSIVFKNKKLCFMYIHCHRVVYDYYFDNCPSVNNKYINVFKQRTASYVAENYPWFFDKKYIRNIDVFVYNLGMTVDDGPSYGEIEQNLEKSQTISVTNAAFKGYMPQHTEYIFKNPSMFTWGDKNLNEMINKNEVDAEKFLKTNFYSAEFVRHYYDKCLDKMKNYEKQCDVKISDFIEQYGENEILYNSVTHPGTKEMMELGMRLMRKLGCNEEDLERIDPQNVPIIYVNAEVVYPDVIRGLNLDTNLIDERLFYPGKDNKKYNFKSYVEAYLHEGKGKQIEYK